jgi:hypothetical protein
MAGETIRDALLRRKRWIDAIEYLWLAVAIVVGLSGVRATSLSMTARVVRLAVGAILYVSGLFFIPSRWLRCLRCGFPMGRLGLGRRKAGQINVCPHCGLALDAPQAEVRVP